MESSTWPETLPSNRIQAIQKLSQGRKVINNLYEMLGQAKKIETGLTSEDGVVVQIVGLFENTLAIINSKEHNQHSMSGFRSPNSSDGHKSNKLYRSLSIPTKTKRGSYKRRKNSWISTQVVSVLVDDGHAWRKYGQKQILNSKHQRSYYRCTYKFDQGCLATKHVQKIIDKPTKYKTTYMGQHTCRNLQRSPPIILDSMNPIDTSILLSFETKGFIEKKQYDPSPNSIKHEPKDFFSVGDLKPNMSLSSDNHLSWDPSTPIPHVPLEPVSMTTSMLDHEHIIPLGVHSRFDHGNMISVESYSTKASPNTYEMERMFGRNDFNDFPYELCF